MCNWYSSHRLHVFLEMKSCSQLSITVLLKILAVVVRGKLEGKDLALWELSWWHTWRTLTDEKGQVVILELCFYLHFNYWNLKLFFCRKSTGLVSLQGLHKHRLMALTSTVPVKERWTQERNSASHHSFERTTKLSWLFGERSPNKTSLWSTNRFLY